MLFAFLGVTVAFSVLLLPTFRFVLLFEILTLVTGCFTTILHFASLIPSVDFALIVAVPLDFAVTTPLLLTVATLELLDDHFPD